MGGAYITCPLYTKDISEDSVRGILGSLVSIFLIIRSKPKFKRVSKDKQKEPQTRNL